MLNACAANLTQCLLPQTLTQSYRLVSTARGTNNYCDNTLTAGWYLPQISGVWYKLATSCPVNNDICGSQGQVWYSGKYHNHDPRGLVWYSGKYHNHGPYGLVWYSGKCHYGFQGCSMFCTLICIII
jgi:hypothetical protein